MPGMIVAPQPLATEEGAKVLAAGGNAFDAALTCAAVQFLVDPHSCGVGGYLVMTCLPAGTSGPPAILDAPAVAGSRVTPAMWQDRVARPNPDGWGYFLQDKVNEIGYPDDHQRSRTISKPPDDYVCRVFPVFMVTKC